MDKIEKALQKLSSKERKAIKQILETVKDGKTKGLNIQKLKGHEDIFRARKGKLRVIYRVSAANEIFVLAIERRSEKTYMKF